MTSTSSQFSICVVTLHEIQSCLILSLLKATYISQGDGQNYYTDTCPNILLYSSKQGDGQSYYTETCPNILIYSSKYPTKIVWISVAADSHSESAKNVLKDE